MGESKVGKVMKKLWFKACEQEGISGDRIIVKFSEGNRFAQLHRELALQALDLQVLCK